MLKRTHLALGIGIALYFLPHMESNKLIFFGTVLAATLLPDIESGFSAPKRNKVFSILPKNVFHKNRFIHTYTLLIPLTIILAILYPVIAFPFFLGYSFHLFLDAFSQQGIQPFWPLKNRSTGRITPGGSIDRILFYVFVIFDVALFVKLFM
jgi:membrane-bound metal-dependent hydrolase YbcI (DUF457 family)